MYTAGCSLTGNEVQFPAAVANDPIPHGHSAIMLREGTVRIAGWYGRTEIQPSERETVAYLVVPLLRSLGWTPQRMAIEWNRIDVALFDALPRQDDNLVAAVEAKKNGGERALRRAPKCLATLRSQSVTSA